MMGTQDDSVSCIACGESVDRVDAREYDKHGDRWEREGKEFEYLCKPCFRELAKHARNGLEDALQHAGAGRVGDEEFLARFLGEYREETAGSE